MSRQTFADLTFKKKIRKNETRIIELVFDNARPFGLTKTCVRVNESKLPVGLVFILFWGVMEREMKQIIEKWC